MSVVLTTRCNLRCRYCYLEPGGRKTLSWPALRAALAAILPLASPGVEIVFTGGEPLLAFPLLERAVSFIEAHDAARGIRFGLITNGTRFTEPRTSFLAAHGFDVSLSFDGVAPAQALRGAGTFHQLDRLLDDLRRRHWTLFDRKLTVAITLAASTLPQLADSVDYFLAKGVRSLAISPALDERDWTSDGIEALDRQLARVSLALRRHYERWGEVPLTWFRKTAPDERAAPGGEGVCTAAQGERLAVDVDGKLYGCIVACRSYRGRPAPGFQRALAALDLGRGFGETRAEGPHGAGRASGRRSRCPAGSGRRAGEVPAPGLSPQRASRPVSTGTANLAARLAAVPSAAARCAPFRDASGRYSSYRRCADCEFLGRCHICPLSGLQDPSCREPRRVPDFLCAFNQVVLAHRDRFPRQPNLVEVIKGQRPAEPGS